ncbi:MAG: radical SAM protein, partial [Thermoplasmata archaeon]|nr:radical SAM protein [Thermoplasmata archaeon]
IFDNEILPVAPIQATRGCPVGCSFCAITNTSFGRTYRERPIEHVINEVETIPQKFLFFCDASLTADPEYTKQLFKEMKDLEKRLLMCNGNVNVLKKDEELLKLASEAGCLQWHIGFESVSQKNIDGVGKNTNKVEDYFSTVQKIHDHGIDVIGEFILGFDNDTVDTFSLTRDFVEHLEVDAAGFNILVPYPGTPLFERLEREGRILTKDWSQYTCTNVVFKPKHIPREMLIEETWKLNKKFFLDRINNVAAKWIHTNKK